MSTTDSRPRPPRPPFAPDPGPLPETEPTVLTVHDLDNLLALVGQALEGAEFAEQAPLDLARRQALGQAVEDLRWLPYILTRLRLQKLREGDMFLQDVAGLGEDVSQACTLAQRDLWECIAQTEQAVERHRRNAIRLAR